MVQKQSDLDVFAKCTENWTRLFDHRPFINGELKFMVREFEEKRSEREIDCLFNIVESATEITNNQIYRLEHLTNANVPKLLDSVNNAIKNAHTIFDIEKAKLQDKTLEKNREKRKAEWNTFFESISEKYTRIDNAFEQKEEELNDLYADLEHKLNITTK